MLPASCYLQHTKLQDKLNNVNDNEKLFIGHFFVVNFINLMLGDFE